MAKRKIGMKYKTDSQSMFDYKGNYMNEDSMPYKRVKYDDELPGFDLFDGISRNP